MMFLAKINETEQLINLINDQNNKYITIIGLVLAIFTFFQWRFSDKQLKNVKSEVKEELRKEYSLETMKNGIEKLEAETSQMQDIIQNDKFTQIGHLGSRVIAKVRLVLKTEDKYIISQYLNDIENNLNNIRAASVEKQYKLFMFDQIKNDVEKILSENDLDDVSRGNLNVITKVINMNVDDLEKIDNQ